MVDEKALREKLRAYICKELIRDASYPLTDTEASSPRLDGFVCAGRVRRVRRERIRVYIPTPI